MRFTCANSAVDALAPNAVAALPDSSVDSATQPAVALVATCLRREVCCVCCVLSVVCCVLSVVCEACVVCCVLCVVG